MIVGGWLGAVFLPDLAAADFAGTGRVSIIVRPFGSPSNLARTPEAVLDDDTILSIEVGDAGAIGNQDIGTLTIQGEGDVQSQDDFRDLGDVDVPYGTLSIHSAYLGPGDPRLGEYGNVSLDPSEGNLEVVNSKLRTGFNMQFGTVTALGRVSATSRSAREAARSRTRRSRVSI